MNHSLKVEISFEATEQTEELIRGNWSCTFTGDGEEYVSDMDTVRESLTHWAAFLFGENEEHGSIDFGGVGMALRDEVGNYPYNGAGKGTFEVWET